MTLFRMGRHDPPPGAIQDAAVMPRTEMPPRPQSPHHRMPPEVAAQRLAEASGDDLSWASAYRSSLLDAAFDPCGAPPMASASSKGTGERQS